MKPQYAAWIADYALKHERLRALCQSATQEMQTAFPELQRVPGHAHWYPVDDEGMDEGLEHWWCVDPETGEVVDPTVSQFRAPPLRYEPWKPGKEVRIGRCMNCGDDIYCAVKVLGELPPREERPPGVSSCTCSVECEKALIEATS